MVTWFQFQSYLQRQSISDLEKHLNQLTKEGRTWQWPRPQSQLRLTLESVSLLTGPQFRAPVTLPPAVTTEAEGDSQL